MQWFCKLLFVLWPSVRLTCRHLLRSIWHVRSKVPLVSRQDVVSSAQFTGRGFPRLKKLWRNCKVWKAPGCHMEKALVGSWKWTLWIDLRWTWHDTDPGVALRWLGVPGGSTVVAMVSTVMVLVTSLCVKTYRGLSVTQFQLESSEAWTITFTFCFSLLLQLSQKSIAATEVPNAAPHVCSSQAPWSRPWLESSQDACLGLLATCLLMRSSGVPCSSGAKKRSIGEKIPFGASMCLSVLSLSLGPLPWCS